MLLWTGLHCSLKRYFILIRWMLLFYSCPYVLLIGNSCTQLGCNATSGSCCKSQALAVCLSDWSQPNVPKEDPLNSCVLRELRCCIPLACLISCFVEEASIRNCLFLFQVTHLYGACSVSNAGRIIQASARFLRQTQVRTVSLLSCFSVLFVVVYCL